MRSSSHCCATATQRLRAKLREVAQLADAARYTAPPPGWPADARKAAAVVVVRGVQQNSPAASRPATGRPDRRGQPGADRELVQLREAAREQDSILLQRRQPAADPAAAAGGRAARVAGRISPDGGAHGLLLGRFGFVKPTMRTRRQGWRVTVLSRTRRRHRSSRCCRRRVIHADPRTSRSRPFRPAGDRQPDQHPERGWPRWFRLPRDSCRAGAAGRYRLPPQRSAGCCR